MGSVTGSQTVFGLAEEPSWGTTTTPSRFLEILSEGLEKSRQTIQSQGIRPTAAGSRPVLDGRRRRVSTEAAAGNVKIEFLTRGMGILLKHLLGTTTPAHTTPATGVHQWVFTLGPQLDKSLTLQKQLRDGSGNVIKALTYPGSKIGSGEFTISTGDLLQLSMDFDCKDEVDNVAAATANYGAGIPFSFHDGKLKLDGSQIGLVSAASAKIDNPLKTDRYFLGNAGRKDQQTENGNAG